MGQEKVEAVIEGVISSELKLIQKSDRFEFNWREEIKHEVYRIRLKNSDEILGLMSLIDWPKELRVEIHLLESSKENAGTKKKYSSIAGCLIAHACGISFERGYYGFVSLISKTELEKHYRNEYGFEKGGVSLFSDTYNSKKLIEKYLL